MQDNISELEHLHPRRSNDVYMTRINVISYRLLKGTITYIDWYAVVGDLSG